MYIIWIFSKKNLIGIKNLQIVFPEKTIKEKKAILKKCGFILVELLVNILI